MRSAERKGAQVAQESEVNMDGGYGDIVVFAASIYQ